MIEEHGPDSGYYDGQILQHGTPGYTVRSYKFRYDRQTNELISKDFIALSSYMTEDKIIVKIVGGEEETEPTDPSETTEPPTDASTETTAPPASDPPSDPTTEPPTTPPTEPPTTPPTEPPTTPPTDPPPVTDPPAGGTE